MSAAEVVPVPAAGLLAAPAPAARLPLAYRHAAAVAGPVLEDRGGAGLHGQDRVPGRRVSAAMCRVGAARLARWGLDPAATASAKEHACGVAAVRATLRSTPAGPSIGATAGCGAAATLRGHGQPPPCAHRSEERCGGSARQGVRARDTLAADGFPGLHAGAADPLGRGIDCGVPERAWFHAGAGRHVPSHRAGVVEPRGVPGDRIARWGRRARVPRGARPKCRVHTRIAPRTVGRCKGGSARLGPRLKPGVSDGCAEIG